MIRFHALRSGPERGPLQSFLCQMNYVADMENSDEPVQIPIDGVLDLHTFQPKEIGEIVPAYLTACREKGILQVRVIHGKGIGNLRRSVHAILKELPEVSSFSLARPEFGGWGATIVNLTPSPGH